MEKSPSENVVPTGLVKIEDTENITKEKAASTPVKAREALNSYTIRTSPCYQTRSSEQIIAPSRTGHGNDRVEDSTCHRLCCISVPYCIVETEKEGKRTKILIVTNRSKKAWKFPGGGWEIDETREQCTMRELLEESGSTGIIKKLSHENYHFSEKHQKINAKYYWHVVEVTNIYEQWAESDLRDRKFVSLDEVETHLGTAELLENWKILAQHIPVS